MTDSTPKILYRDLRDMIDDKEEDPNTTMRFVTLRRVMKDIHRDWMRVFQCSRTREALNAGKQRSELSRFCSFLKALLKSYLFDNLL